MTFSPSFDGGMNQTVKNNQMLHDIHMWAEYIPDKTFWMLARLREKMRRGAPLNEEEEKKLWSVWKTTNYFKNVKRQIPPPDEERKFKAKPTKERYV